MLGNFCNHNRRRIGIECGDGRGERFMILADVVLARRIDRFEAGASLAAPGRESSFPHSGPSGHWGQLECGRSAFLDTTDAILAPLGK